MPKFLFEAPNGRSIAIEKETIIVGRAFLLMAFGIVDPHVSREHCQVRWRGRNFWLRDGSVEGVNSLAGTFLDNSRIPPDTWTPLPKNGTLQIGQTTLLFEYESPYSIEFDLMISYSRKDEKPVLEIFREIQGLGLRPWMDQKTQTEHHYKKGIEEIITRVPAVIIFWGGDSMGNTHAAEVEVATNLYIHKKIQNIFLVVLPGSENPGFGQFLSNIDWYDLRKNGEEQRLYKDLELKLINGE